MTLGVSTCWRVGMMLCDARSRKRWGQTFATFVVGFWGRGCLTRTQQGHVHSFATFAGGRRAETHLRNLLCLLYTTAVDVTPPLAVWALR